MLFQVCYLFIYFIYFWWKQSLNSGLHTCKVDTFQLSTLQSIFSSSVGTGLQSPNSQTFFPGWFWGKILPISTSQVAKIRGMSPSGTTYSRVVLILDAQWYDLCMGTIEQREVRLIYPYYWQIPNQISLSNCSISSRSQIFLFLVLLLLLLY
jgi:hypothetical protein